MKKRVFLDGIHTAIIDINEKNKTVIAEIEKGSARELIYAEKFEKICNYEKEALKAVITYLKCSLEDMSIKNIAPNIVATMLLAFCFSFG